VAGKVCEVGVALLYDHEMFCCKSKGKVAPVPNQVQQYEGV